MRRTDDRISENKGFSLIEVIVVVLIIGIVSTIATLSVSYAYGSSADRCAKRLSSFLDLTRTQSMGMVEGSVLLRLEKNDDEDYEAISIKKVMIDGVWQEIELDREEIGNSALTVDYYVGGTGTPLATGAHIDFTYSKSSGAFTSDYSSIKIIGAKTSTVTLVKDTGRNYVD